MRRLFPRSGRTPDTQRHGKEVSESTGEIQAALPPHSAKPQPRVEAPQGAASRARVTGREDATQPPFENKKEKAKRGIRI